MKIKLISSEKLPSWFAYPPDFLLAIQEGLYQIGPWKILTGDVLAVWSEGIKKRYPQRSLIPFYRRLDCDDVACWDEKTFPKVEIIHDFCTPGWECAGSFASFNAWLEAAETDAIDYD
jgi:hypothetical protein